MKLDSYWSTGHSIAEQALRQAEYPWDVLDQIPLLIKDYMAGQDTDEWVEPMPGVYVHVSAEVHPTATFMGSALVGPRTYIGPYAYIREHVIIGADCVVSNSSEVKQAVLFDGVQVPHFNYVGDSILGYKAHLGAGAIISNYRSDHQEVRVRLPQDGGGGSKQLVGTGRRKFGCLMGDEVEVGCNSVINPGSLLERGVRVDPLTDVRGHVPAEHIRKRDGRLIKLEAR